MEDLLEKSLTCKQRLPLKVVQLVAQPEQSEILTYEQANEALLLRLEAKTAVAHENDEEDALYQELHRLEVKMDLILDLLTEVIGQAKILPDSIPVEFNEYAIQIPSVSGVEEGLTMRLELYLDPTFPKPVILFATVYSTEPLRLEILHESEVVADQLSRYIFRQHRRKIAKQRT